jgi:hypothetical protein
MRHAAQVGHLVVHPCMLAVGRQDDLLRGFERHCTARWRVVGLLLLQGRVGAVTSAGTLM